MNIKIIHTQLHQFIFIIHLIRKRGQIQKHIIFLKPIAMKKGTVLLLKHFMFDIVKR